MDNRAAKILAIDKGQDNLNLLMAAIAEAFPDALVRSAPDGESGRLAASAQQPDVIILGSMMPGMDSCEVCRMLKADEALRGIPVVFVTAGKGRKKSRSDALACGADAFLSWPIDESELAAQVRAMVKIRDAYNAKQGTQMYPAAAADETARNSDSPQTDTQRLYEALKREQLLNEAIIDSIPGYLYVYDENGKLIRWNKRHETMTGYSGEELSRMTLAQWFDREDLARVNTAVQDVFEKGFGEVEARLRIKNGDSLLVRSSGVPFTVDSKKYFVGVGVDITQQKRMEEQLKQNVKDLLESQRIARLGTWRLDLAAGQVSWSEELYKMYGFDPSLPPPPYTEHMKLFTGESWERLSSSLEQTRTSGAPYELELETVTKGGANGWMWVRCEAEKDLQGNIVSLWGAAQDITEHKKKELELRQSEERFQLLFNKAPIGYQSLDFDGCFIDVNQQWLDTLGYTKQEVIGKWFGDFLCPEYVDAFRKRFPVFKAQGYIHSEFEMLAKDAKRLYIAFEGKIGYGADGAFKQTHCTLQDITNQHKAEQALAASEERYKCLFEYSGIGIGYFTAEGIVISFNKKALENLGGKLEDYIGKSLWALFPKEQADRYFERISAALSADQPHEYEDHLVFHQKNIWFSSIFTRIMDSSGEVVGVQIASLDITGRKQVEEALLESQAILKAAFENSQAGIAIADAPDGKLRYVNKAGLLIRNKTEEDLVRDVDIHTYADRWKMYHFDGTPYAEDEVPLARAVLKGETCSEEFVIRRDDQEDRHVLANAAPILDPGGNVKAGVVVFLDITEKRQAEEEIRKQNELFASLLKLLPVGVFMVDAAQGKPLVANDMAITLMGRGILPDANELNLSEVYKAYKVGTGKHYPTAEMPIALGMRGISSHIDDMVVERPDGTKILLEVFGTPVQDNNGKPWASLVTFMDITKRKKEEGELIYLSYHDYLTGFRNRRFFEEELLRIDAAAKYPLSVMMCDINGLKLINDSFGHDCGDRLLVKAAETIRKACRNGDIICRVGGDEFAVLMPTQALKKRCRQPTG